MPCAWKAIWRRVLLSDPSTLITVPKPNFSCLTFCPIFHSFSFVPTGDTEPTFARFIARVTVPRKRISWIHSLGNSAIKRDGKWRSSFAYNRRLSA